VALGAVFALLFGAMFPPFDAVLLALIAPAPVILVALRTRGAWRSAAGVAIASAPMWWFHHAWIGEITGAGLWPLVGYLSLWPGLFVLIGARMATRWPGAWVVLWAPVVWGALEFLRGEVVLDGYPWFMVGEAEFSSVLRPPGIYLTGIVGVALSVLIAYPAHRVLENPSALRRSFAQPLGWVWIALILWIVVVRPALGIGSGPEPTGNRDAPNALRVGIVQTNIPQSVRGEWPLETRVEDLERFLAMTRAVAAMEPAPDLIVWPETMFPGETLTPEVIARQRELGVYYSSVGVPVTHFHDRLVAVQAELGIPMLVGAIGLEGYTITPTPSGGFSTETGARFNSVFVVADGAVDPVRYDKTFLTPFGEVMPYISAWPWLEQKLLALGADGMTFELSAGTRVDPLVVRLRDGREIRVATPVCFEATMAEVVRAMVFAGGKRRADLIVQVTNDGWFGEFTPGKVHHARLAQWRAVENRTPVVRVANTGISMAFDASGRELELMPEGPRDRVEWAGVVDVPIASGAPGTVFSRIGNLPAWIAVVATVVMGFVVRGSKRTEGPAPASDGSRGVAGRTDRSARV
jgi:apolipoprotein N-acyltransferase